MTRQAEGVEMDTRNRRPGRPCEFDHETNKRRLAKQFFYIPTDVRAMLLNVIEANARHWYMEAGGSRANFELLFNNEIHAEQ